MAARRTSIDSGAMVDGRGDGRVRHVVRVVGRWMQGAVAVVQERGGRLRLTDVKSCLLQASELLFDGSCPECSSGRSSPRMLSKKSVAVVYKMN